MGGPGRPRRLCRRPGRAGGHDRRGAGHQRQEKRRGHPAPERGTAARIGQHHPAAGLDGGQRRRHRLVQRPLVCLYRPHPRAERGLGLARRGGAGYAGPARRALARDHRPRRTLRDGIPAARRRRPVPLVPDPRQRRARPPRPGAALVRHEYRRRFGETHRAGPARRIARARTAQQHRQHPGLDARPALAAARRHRGRAGRERRPLRRLLPRRAGRRRHPVFDVGRGGRGGSGIAFRPAADDRSGGTLRSGAGGAQRHARRRYAERSGAGRLHAALRPGRQLSRRAGAGAVRRAARPDAVRASGPGRVQRTQRAHRHRHRRPGRDRGRQRAPVRSDRARPCSRTSAKRAPRPSAAAI